MKRLAAATCLLLLSGVVSVPAAEVGVAKWKGGAACAVSYTFDDGLLDQYTLAFPALRAAGLRGTFWLIGSKVGDPSGVRSKAERHTPTMTWDQVRELAAAGQEVASHGLSHKSCSKMDNDEIVREVTANRTLIKEKAGVDAVTFAYPYNAKRNRDGEDITALVESQGLVGSRRVQKALGGGITTEQANALVEQARRRGEWLVFMTHGIARGYDHFTDPGQFYAHLRWVAGQRNVWVAPFREVCAYEKERDAVTLAVAVEADGSGLRITPRVEGLDATLFREKLTLVDSTGRIVCDFDPFAGSFTIPRPVPAPPDPSGT